MLHLAQNVRYLVSQERRTLVLYQRATQLFDSSLTSSITKRKHGTIPFKDWQGIIAQNVT
jgi:hypothetical protein